jgi:hypothetical protein
MMCKDECTKDEQINELREKLATAQSRLRMLQLIIKKLKPSSPSLSALTGETLDVLYCAKCGLVWPRLMAGDDFTVTCRCGKEHGARIIPSERDLCSNRLRF